MAGRRACWVAGAGLRPAGVGGLAAASEGASVCCGPLGSAVMMLTGGIDAEDGK